MFGEYHTTVLGIKEKLNPFLIHWIVHTSIYLFIAFIQEIFF